MFAKPKRRLAQRTFELQRDETDCGVAAIASIIQYYDGFVPLEEIRVVSGTTTAGTTMLGLMHSAEKFGLKTEAFQGSIEELRKIEIPTLLHIVKNETIEHYVVCYGFDKDKFLIGDPEDGVKEITSDELELLWKSKALLIFSPKKEFIKRKKENRKKYLWIWSAIKKDRNLVTSTTLIGFLIAGLNFATAIFTEKLVDNLIPKADSELLILSLCAWFLLIGIKVLLSYVRGLGLINQSYNLNKRLVGQYINQLFHLPLTFFGSRKKGDLISRLFDNENIQESAKKVLSIDVIDILTLVISIVIIAFYHSGLAVFLLILIPVYFLIVHFYHSKIYKSNRVLLAAYADNESQYIDALTGMTSIKQEGKEDAFSDNLIKGFDNYQEKIRTAERINMRFNVTSEILGILAMFFIFSFCISSIINDDMELGDMIAIFGISGLSLASTGRLAMAATHLQEAKAALDRSYEVMSLTREQFGTSEWNQSKRIELKEISFGFPGRMPLLEKINAQFGVNEIECIEGNNGSGKSTIVQLLQGFIQPNNGKISIGGIDIHDFSKEALRSYFGVVAQDVKVFNNSLLFNITLDRTSEYDDVSQFCRKWGFDQFFDQLPEGFDTLLGEEGVKVSGGQKQLIGLARALYGQPEYLLLDEFTSSMDETTKQFAIGLVKKLSKTTRVLVISHDQEIVSISKSKFIIKNKQLLPS